MTSRLPRLQFWSRKSCQACKGQPTPPPCYDCTQNLETPPPTYASLDDHICCNDNISTLDPFTEEFSDAEDTDLEPYIRQHLDSETLITSDNEYDPRSANLLNGHHQNFEVNNLSHAVGRIALAFLPEGQRSPQTLAFSTQSTSNRTRHISSPVHSEVPHHVQLSRISSTPQLILQDNFSSEGAVGPATDISGRSLLSALTFPTASYYPDELDQVPISPRGASPLPCQLLIPE